MPKKKLITSALPYVNNVPHLGNIIGCVLSADVYARFCRSKGYETLYICATDEYGTATENKAREEGLTPKQICDKFHVLHKKVYDHFNIQFDFFGRTSHPEHTEVTQSIYMDLENRGMILEEESEQTFCEHDQIFLADRYVAGTCPHCEYSNARGDQCDGCGKLLQPTELNDPKCQVCGNTPMRKSTKHLYLNLPKLEQDLREFHKKSQEFGNWNSNAVSTTNSWLDKGLVPRPITRDLTWGVQVPRKEYENKVFYVWFDAPIGYISATKRALPESWKDWWQSPDDTNLYQFMAKDNIPFHTVVFPASLIGTGKPWTLLHHISSTEYLNYENDKFSKSRNVGVFGMDVIDTDIPVDLWRFYLLYNRPEKSDANFLWDAFLEDINSSFIDNIGNLMNRVMVFYQKNFGTKIDSVELDKEHRTFTDENQSEIQEILKSFEDVQLKEALKQILALGKKGNKFFQDLEPWKLIKEDKQKTQSGLMVLMFLLRDLGLLLEPFMPDTSRRMLKMLGSEEQTLQNIEERELLKGKTLDQPQLLFQKLQKKKIESYKTRFSGNRESTEPDPIDAWQKVVIKVGEIKEVEKHPTADRLFVEKIDLGEGRMRTIVSGLVGHYKPEELIGKRVLVVANLEPAQLRGVESEGMLLAAESKKKLEVVQSSNWKIGEIAQLEEDSNEVSKPEKISIDEFLATQMKVEDSTAKVGQKILMVAGAPITTDSITKGKIR